MCPRERRANAQTYPKRGYHESRRPEIVCPGASEETVLPASQGIRAGENLNRRNGSSSCRQREKQLTFTTHYYFSNRFRPGVRFRHDRFRAVLTPDKLRKQSLEFFGTERVERLGQKVMVTGKERTLVEVLERPQYSGGFEETYRCLGKMPYFQPETVLEYLELRNHKSLYARVGFFLEQHREDFHTEESLLVQLEHNKPTQPIYWNLHRKGGVLVKRWNLIVPNAVVERSWEEG